MKDVPETLRLLGQRLRAEMPEESTIDLDQHAHKIAEAVLNARMVGTILAAKTRPHDLSV